MEISEKEQAINNVILNLCIRNDKAVERIESLETDLESWKSMYFSKSDKITELEENNLDLSTVSERYSKLLSELGQACSEDPDLCEKIDGKITDYGMLLKDWEE